MTTPSDALDRRPLKSRQQPVFQKLAGQLVRAGVSPNTISVFGMLAGIASGATLWTTAHVEGTPHRLLWIASASLVQLRLLCNMLDGMVAIGSGKQSRLGELYNELPDRVSDSFTLVALGYVIGGHPTLGWCAALLAMATAYVRAVGKGAGAGSDFSGPMAKPHRMFTVTCLCIAMAIHPALATHRVPLWVLVLIVAGCVATLLRRTWRVARRLRAEA